MHEIEDNHWFIKKGNVYGPHAVAVIQGNVVGHFPQNMSGVILG